MPREYLCCAASVSVTSYFGGFTLPQDPLVKAGVCLSVATAVISSAPASRLAVRRYQRGGANRGLVQHRQIPRGIDNQAFRAASINSSTWDFPVLNAAPV